MTEKPKRKNNTPQCPFCQSHDVAEKTVGLPDGVYRCHICGGLWDVFEIICYPTYAGRVNVLRHTVRDFWDTLLEWVGL